MSQAGNAEARMVMYAPKVAKPHTKIPVSTNRLAQRGSRFAMHEWQSGDRAEIRASPPKFASSRFDHDFSAITTHSARQGRVETTTIPVRAVIPGSGQNAV